MVLLAIRACLVRYAQAKGLAGVYIIGPEARRPVKIGFAGDPYRRLSNMQTDNWMKVELYEVAWLRSQSSAALFEKACHAFAGRSIARLNGEWFDTDVDTARQVIWDAGGHFGVRLVPHADLLAHVERQAAAFEVLWKEWLAAGQLKQTNREYRLYRERCLAGHEGTDGAMAYQTFMRSRANKAFLSFMLKNDGAPAA